MNKNETQLIIDEISANPNLITIITPEVLLLKFLRLTEHSDVRKVLIDNKDLNISIGYLSKIIENAQIKFIHLFRINKEYFINNKCYDYTTDNNKVIPKISNTFFNINKDDLFKSNLDLIIFNPDMIIIQEEKANIDDTEVMKQIISQKEMDFLLNLRTYDKSNVQQLNGNFYKLDLIMTADHKFYFNSNGNQYVYDHMNNTLNETKWDIASFRPVFSVFNRQTLNPILPAIQNHIHDKSIS